MPRHATPWQYGSRPSMDGSTWLQAVASAPGTAVTADPVPMSGCSRPQSYSHTAPPPWQQSFHTHAKIADTRLPATAFLRAGCLPGYLPAGYLPGYLPDGYLPRHLSDGYLPGYLPDGYPQLATSLVTFQLATSKLATSKSVPLSWLPARKPPYNPATAAAGGPRHSALATSSKGDAERSAARHPARDHATLTSGRCCACHCAADCCGVSDHTEFFPPGAPAACGVTHGGVDATGVWLAWWRAASASAASGRPAAAAACIARHVASAEPGTTTAAPSPLLLPPPLLDGVANAAAGRSAGAGASIGMGRARMAPSRPPASLERRDGNCAPTSLQCCSSDLRRSRADEAEAEASEPNALGCSDGNCASTLPVSVASRPSAACGPAARAAVKRGTRSEALWRRVGVNESSDAMM
eukprot:364874-Chlamydomonas_euryale.AAC.5